MALLLLCGQAVKSFAQVQQLLLVLQILVQAFGNSIQAVEQSEQAARDGPCGPTLTWNGNTGPQGSHRQSGKGHITVNLTLTRASLPRAGLRLYWADGSTAGTARAFSASCFFLMPNPSFTLGCPMGPGWLLQSPIKRTGVSLPALSQTL